MLESAIGEPYMIRLFASRLLSPSGVFFSLSSRYGTMLTWYRFIFEN